MTQEILRADLSEPTTPSADYNDVINREALHIAETTRYPDSPFTGAPKAILAELAEEIERISPDLRAIAHEIHDDPELAFEEHHAVARLRDYLAQNDLESRANVYGVETAFESDFEPTPGTDGPTVGILSEYDALPAIGHACGHNVSAAAGLGAYVAVVAVLRKHPGLVGGKVVYYGTPAEEGHSGKEHMARGGAFAPGSLDACMMVHSHALDLAETEFLGRRLLDIEFTGIPAHASAAPWLGRNALDAATLMMTGIGLMRQQTPPEDRIHVILTEGGTRSSIITEKAHLKMYVRSPRTETLVDLSARVENVAKGAALMTGCGVTITWDEHPATLPVRYNSALTGRWVAALRSIGRDPLPKGSVPASSAASTDFGNVSFRVPGIHPMISITDDGSQPHTHPFAIAAGTPTAEQAAVDSAYGMAATTLDMLFDPALAAAVREEFDAQGGAADVSHMFD